MKELTIDEKLQLEIMWSARIDGYETDLKNFTEKYGDNPSTYPPHALRLMKKLMKKLDAGVRQYKKETGNE